MVNLTRPNLEAGGAIGGLVAESDTRLLNDQGGIRSYPSIT